MIWALRGNHFLSILICGCQVKSVTTQSVWFFPVGANTINSIDTTHTAEGTTMTSRWRCPGEGLGTRDWAGLIWTGLDWTGLDWTGLDWTGTPSNEEHGRRHDLECKRYGSRPSLALLFFRPQWPACSSTTYYVVASSTGWNEAVLKLQTVVENATATVLPTRNSLEIITNTVDEGRLYSAFGATIIYL
jgi:hypothetical protein